MGNFDPVNESTENSRVKFPQIRVLLYGRDKNLTWTGSRPPYTSSALSHSSLVSWDCRMAMTKLKVESVSLIMRNSAVFLSPIVSSSISSYAIRSRKCSMDYKDAIAIFENNTKRSVVQIERCSVGIANYVFIVSTANEKFVLRCSKDENAYKDTVYWLNRLSVCEIPIPIVLSEGKYKDYSYLILSYIRGDDIGNVYCKLNDSEKKQIAKEVVKIQRKVSRLDIHADMEWTWNCFVDKMLNRAEKRIKRKNYFDFNKICIIKKLQQEIQEYLDKVPIAPYLDDISTKNLLIYEGNVSGIIDIDWMGFGDMLTFVALTRVSLLNMDLDTKYIDYLLDEIRPNTIEYKAFIFYCLIYCVDFMGEIGMQFLDKTIPVNENIIERLNDIFDFLMEEWDKYCKR